MSIKCNCSSKVFGIDKIEQSYNCFNLNVIRVYGYVVSSNAMIFACTVSRSSACLSNGWKMLRSVFDESTRGLTI